MDPIANTRELMQYSNRLRRLHTGYVPFGSIMFLYAKDVSRVNTPYKVEDLYFQIPLE